jgi:hypothetical protein
MQLMGKFSVAFQGRSASNAKSTINMLNVNKVNAGSSYFLPATFCVIFCDSGRILDSWNPVKYICNPEVNGALRPLKRNCTAKSIGCAPLRLRTL